MTAKIFASLGSLIEELPGAGDGAALTKGVYDLFHVGHLRSLRFARSKGKRLIVAVKTDAVVKAQKGASRPIISFDDRVEILAAIDAVDIIVPLETMDVSTIVSALNVSCYVGSHFDERLVSMANINGTFDLIRFPKSIDVSSSDIIKKIVESAT